MHYITSQYITISYTTFYIQQLTESGSRGVPTVAVMQRVVEA